MTPDEISETSTRWYSIHPMNAANILCEHASGDTRCLHLNWLDQRRTKDCCTAERYFGSKVLVSGSPEDQCFSVSRNLVVSSQRPKHIQSGEVSHIMGPTMRRPAAYTQLYDFR